MKKIEDFLADEQKKFENNNIPHTSSPKLSEQFLTLTLATHNINGLK